MRNRGSHLFLHLISAALIGIAGCAHAPGNNPGDASANGDGSMGPVDGGGDASAIADLGPPDLAPAVLVIAPQNQVVTVMSGQAVPTVQYTATYGGQTVAASFAVDRGEIGSIGASTGLFTPTGTVGGKATVSAVYQGMKVTTGVTVQIFDQQNGDPAWQANPPPPGPGGYGGVGGNGPAPAASAQQGNTLNGTPTTDSSVKLLYPYDATVWPRGLLAPLLQWDPGAHSFDSVYVHLQENNYDYKGYFAANATPFLNLPIPQAAWDQLTYSNGGENVKVAITFAEGTTAYGPYVENWTIAPGTLRGTVYYNSYGTGLVANSGEGSYPNGTGPAFGGATLAIHPGATDPVLVAGTPSSDTSGCRVCHSVGASGHYLMTQRGNAYGTTSLYDLMNGNAESSIASGDSAFPGILPDGTMFFSNAGALWGTASSQLYSLPAGNLVASTLPLTGLQAVLPAFSPDGKHVAFNFYGGTGSDQKSLAAMDFAESMLTFSNLRTLATPPNGDPAVWPSFLPTSDAVIYEIETVSNEFGFTRNGVRGELWWVDLATKTATRLDKLNGKGYLPTGAATGHDDDTTLNYEPTVNPIVSGGYAWVVFTSRRLYGNVATIGAWSSDPRDYNLLAQNAGSQITTKKLWVAAIDLNAAPGTDPSHPAFYLPAQELHAGNSRGFWTVEPCRMDGTSCETGDECCGGYCQPSGDGGLACTSMMPVCAGELEKCMTDTDCCGVNQGVKCINGRCAQVSMPDMGCIPAGGSCASAPASCCNQLLCVNGTCGIP